MLPVLHLDPVQHDKTRHKTRTAAVMFITKLDQAASFIWTNRAGRGGILTRHHRTLLLNVILQF